MELGSPMGKSLHVWDVVKGRGKLGEGQVVEIIGPNARVYFQDEEIIVRQSYLSFLRSGVPKEFLRPGKPVGGRKSSGGGSPKYPPEYGKEQLKSLIAEGMKFSPVLTKAYNKLINDLTAEIGNDWHFIRGGFHGRTLSKKTGNMRNTFNANLHLVGDDFGNDHSCIHIYICHAGDLPPEHHEKFKFKPKDYHGNDAFVGRIGIKDLSKLEGYRSVLSDVIKFTRHGHV